MSQPNPAHDALSTPLNYRRGTLQDLAAAHTLFLDTISDRVWRMGIQEGERIPC